MQGHINPPKVVTSTARPVDGEQYAHPILPQMQFGGQARQSVSISLYT